MKLFNRENKPSHPCLTCGVKLGKNFSEVRYKYKDGEGTAYICLKCADEFDKSNMNKETEDGFSV